MSLGDLCQIYLDWDIGKRASVKTENVGTEMHLRARGKVRAGGG